MKKIAFKPSKSRLCRKKTLLRLWGVLQQSPHNFLAQKTRVSLSRLQPHLKTSIFLCQ